MRITEPLKMKTYKEAEGDHVNISKWGCVFLSVATFVSKRRPLTIEEILAIFDIVADGTTMTNECFIKSFKNLLTAFGFENAEFEDVKELPDEECDGIVFTRKHCFYFSQKEGLVRIEDPGYWNDIKIDENNMFTRADGSHSKDPDGNNRFVDHFKIIRV